MSSKSTPRPGSLLAKVIEHLRSEGEDAQISAGTIATMFAVDKTGVATQMRKGVTWGILKVHKEGNAFIWSLDNDEPAEAGPPPEMSIATWSDGDVVVNNVQLTDDGVIFTRKQIQTLVEHVTRPFYKLQVAAHE